MSGVRAIVDSNVLIYLSNGQLEIENLFKKYNEVLISRITHIEVLGYDFKNEEDESIVLQLVSHFPILELDSEIGAETIKIRKSKKIKLPDAIICATALVHNCELVTANEKDFIRIEGVQIFNPIK